MENYKKKILGKSLSGLGIISGWLLINYSITSGWLFNNKIVNTKWFVVHFIPKLNTFL